MKSLVAITLLALAVIRAPAQSAPPSAAVLTDDETARIMADITAVQREFAKTKKEVLASALERFRTAAGGDAQATDFFLASWRVVNLDRKPAATKEEQEARAKGEWQAKALASAGEAASPTVLRLQLQLLVLMLEARAPVADDRKVTDAASVLRNYMQGVISILPAAATVAPEDPPEKRNGPGPDRRGRRSNDDDDRAEDRERLRRKGGALRGLRHDVMDTLFASAYNLGAYFEPPAQWPRSPADFHAAYANIILPALRAGKKEDLPAAWDEHLRGETLLQQATLSPDAFASWGAGGYKDLCWSKWLDLLSHGVNATSATAELVKIVRENPSHPSLKRWIADLAKVAETMGGLKFDDVPGTPPPGAPQ